jgi:N6-L-threonylcarbamoyladenine synthase
MTILAIETSCDETAVAIIKSNKQGTKCEVLSHTVLSQIDIHKEYGGVFPALAKREHARVITALIEKCAREAGCLRKKKEEAVSKKLETNLGKILHREENVRVDLLELFKNYEFVKIDAIAVTSGPGLEPALWVGINTALALGVATGLPVYPINHMEGHIIAATLQGTKNKNGNDVYTIPKIELPSLALLISGGHTEIVHIKKIGTYKIIGQTRDDAVGEAFDKVARMLGLSYPGGPEISKLAKSAREDGVVIDEEMRLPRPMLRSKDFDFSFSGIKTSVLYKIQKYKKLDDDTKRRIALDFENAAAEVLTKKTVAAVLKNDAKAVIVGGGVSANTHIRKELEMTLNGKAKLFVPGSHLSTDNALMIAVTAMVHIANNKKPKKKIIANGNWHL